MDYVISLGRRQRKRQAVHERVLEVADQLFRERGIGGTTVEDIAEGADVARQTVFNHFPYKEALAVELVADDVQTVALRAQALLEAETPALEVLYRTAEWLLESAIAQGELGTVVARELLHPDRERASRAAQPMPLREMFEAILVQAREEGAVRENLELDVVAARISAILTTMMAQILVCDAQQIRREFVVCFDILFHGITDR